MHNHRQAGASPLKGSALRRRSLKRSPSGSRSRRVSPLDPATEIEYSQFRRQLEDTSGTRRRGGRPNIFAKSTPPFGVQQGKNCPYLMRSPSFLEFYDNLLHKNHEGISYSGRFSEKEGYGSND
mmetsp:Transcript_64/g.141  ORF Transcript_64/g.141 Transcript_64/m.141 type:complete len:124 (+) Transcript_64:48-419(+)